MSDYWFLFRTTALRVYSARCAQICQRGAPLDYRLMGELFKRLIQLSPSRSDALERVQQFEQLLNSRTYSYSGSSDEKSTPSQIAVNEAALSFDVDDIDFITSTSFNYGVGLV